MISKDDVKKIAGLARIKLSESEEESFQKDLSSILDYVESLSEVDTMMVEPTLNAASASNVIRQDEKIEKDVNKETETAATIVKSAPDHDDGFIKVKAVM